MRIAIAADDAVVASTGGCGQYSRNLIEHLVAQAPGDEFVLFHARAPDARAMPLDGARNVRWVELPFSRRALHRGLWPILGGPLLERWVGEVDVVHNLLTTAWVPAKAPEVMTIHDLFPERFPEDEYKTHARWFRRLLLRRARRDSAAIIAVSEATRVDVLELMQVPPERVTVIHHALPARPSTDGAGVLARHGLATEPYLFFIGRLEPRKNLLRLIEAFATLNRSGPTPPVLVLAGSESAQGALLRARVEELGLTSRVRFLGHVSEEDVRPLMEGATLFVYPSLYEGFGLPLLEAMACGAPIAAASGSSIPEVAGPAARYFDPRNTDDMVTVLRDLLASPEARVELVQQGRAQLARFSWQRAADDTLAVYRAVAREAGVR